MKKLQILFLFTAALFSVHTMAGRVETSPVTISDNGGGSLSAQGSLASARFSKNKVEEMGCRILGIAGTVTQVLCTAADSEGVRLSCTSTDANIIDAVQGITAYAWIRIDTSGATLGDADNPEVPGSCDRVFVSTRSFHLPPVKKPKKKRDHDDDDD